jgi:hypothetical protein
MHDWDLERTQLETDTRLARQDANMRRVWRKLCQWYRKRVGRAMRMWMVVGVDVGVARTYTQLQARHDGATIALNRQLRTLLSEQRQRALQVVLEARNRRLTPGWETGGGKREEDEESECAGSGAVTDVGGLLPFSIDASLEKELLAMQARDAALDIADARRGWEMWLEHAYAATPMKLRQRRWKVVLQQNASRQTKPGSATNSAGGATSKEPKKDEEEKDAAVESSGASVPAATPPALPPLSLLHQRALRFRAVGVVLRRRFDYLRAWSNHVRITRLRGWRQWACHEHEQEGKENDQVGEVLITDIHLHGCRRWLLKSMPPPPLPPSVCVRLSNAF